MRQPCLSFPYYRRRQRCGRVRSLAFAAVAVIAVWTIARAALGADNLAGIRFIPVGRHGTLSVEGPCDGGSAAGLTVVVQPGDTLWSIAARNYGQSANVSTLVGRITKRNGLRTTVLQPGQRLVLPCGVDGVGER